MQTIPSCDEYDASYQALRELVMHPEFQRVLAEIQCLPPVEGLQATLTQLTPEALAARGIPMRNDCTITTQISQDFTVSNDRTTDAAATEQDRANGPVIRVNTRICFGICPACICGNFAPVRNPSDYSD